MAGDAHVACSNPSVTSALSTKFLWGAGYSWMVSKKWTGKGTCFCFTAIIRTIPVHFLDKFSQVAQQTQQQGRRSINALRLCLTSAKNGGQCQSCHLSINVNNLCLVEKSSKQSTSINIQQNSSDFALSCPMPHVVDPCPLGQQLSQPGPAIHIRGGWLSVTATCPIQGKALVKNLNFNN